MAIELYDKVDFGIKLADKTSRYPITIKLHLEKEDEEKLEQFKSEKEEEFKSVLSASTRSADLTKKISRLQEDISDLTEEISLSKEEADPKEARKRLKDKKAHSKKLRVLEDEYEALQKEFPVSVFKDATIEIQESVAKHSFLVSVVADEKRDALTAAIEKYNLKYSVIVQELNRLAKAAKKKK